MCIIILILLTPNVVRAIIDQHGELLAIFGYVVICFFFLLPSSRSRLLIFLHMLYFFLAMLIIKPGLRMPPWINSEKCEWRKTCDSFNNAFARVRVLSLIVTLVFLRFTARDSEFCNHTQSSQLSRTNMKLLSWIVLPLIPFVSGTLLPVISTKRPN